ncbi:unnamed protein product [Diatraea saccharalis]|uniref:Peptidylprolyl isomerase n=1 Tax=Diatraea saccharalis TaxID=40085 RepID=A0A9N9QY60_9NEOP|nr:unnamed protein product [Diatraea saccharalis]
MNGSTDESSFVFPRASERRPPVRVLKRGPTSAGRSTEDVSPKRPPPPDRAPSGPSRPPRPRMASSPLGEIEELALCSCCKRRFDEGERPPKLLACKHHFCLACARSVLGKGREVYCVHCWKRTELPDGRADALPTHRPVLALARRLAAPAPAPAPSPLPSPPSPPPACPAHALPALWCCACDARACRGCGQHAAHAHALRPPREARALLARQRRDLLHELRRLAARRRDFLLRALDAATALKLRLEAELAAPPALGGPEPTSLPAAAAERERLRARLAEAALRARLEDLVRAAAAPLDFELIRRALAAPAPEPPPAGERRDPVLFLGNYCAARLYERRREEDEGPAAAAGGSPAGAIGAGSPPPARGPGAFPLFYFDVEVNGAPLGRVVIEVRGDVAPRMARNFAALATGELGVGYRGCAVFQCWENESVITGDFELNDGRGGRSAFEESHFMPDDTRLAAVRGAVGMRRSQKRHDNLGLVGSQFRIVLREMRGFTAIFGSVVEGLELVDRLSRAGDSAGKPHSAILISSCGRLN